MSFREYISEMQDDGLVKRLQDIAKASPFVSLSFKEIRDRNMENDDKLKKLVKSMEKDYDFNLDDENSGEMQNDIVKLVKKGKSIKEMKDDYLVNRLEDIAQASPFVDLTYKEITRRNMENDDKLKELVKSLIDDYDYNLDDESSEELQKEIVKVVKSKKRINEAEYNYMVTRVQDIAQTSPFVSISFKDIRDRNVANDEKLRKLVDKMIDTYGFNVADKDSKATQQAIADLIKSK